MHHTTQAARASSACPMGATIGILIGSFLHDRFNSLGRCLFFTALMSISLFCLHLLSQPAYASSSHAAVYLLFTFGLTMSPAKYLIAPIYCARVGGEKRTATLLSLMDVPGFLLTSVFYRHWHSIVHQASGGADPVHDPTTGGGNDGWAMVFRLLALANAVALVTYVGHAVLESACRSSTSSPAGGGAGPLRPPPRLAGASSSSTSSNGSVLSHV